jgi:phosphatidylinositol glycan class F
VLSAQSPFDEVYGAAAGAGVGAWLGAVPIPLDWDREWQKWPVTIVAGMYMGWAAGKVLGGWVVKGKRIEFD